jgi:hypothetical protein
MKKIMHFTIETQTENQEIISICHLNEKAISLELSDVARKMFKLNRILFGKINSTTKLLGGSVYREQIKTVKQDRNKLGVKLLNKYEHEEVEILSLNFTSNTMNKRQSILTKNGKRIDFDPSELTNKKDLGPLDPQNLTFDDVAVSTIICEIEEIDLFQDQGIKTYMLKDFMKDSEGSYNVAYRLELRAETEFKEYIEFILKELDKSISFLLSYSNSIDAPTNYDHQNLEFKKSFKDSILNQLQITDEMTSVNLGSGVIKSSDFGKAALNYYNSMLLLTPNVSKNLYGTIIKGLLPTTKTSPSNIKSILNNFQTLAARIRKEYNIFNKDTKTSRFPSKISSTKKSTKEFVYSTTEKFDIEKEVLGYNVFSETQTGLNKFTTSTYRSRVSAEEAKYYPSIDISDETRFMRTRERAAFTRNTNAPSFVTPANLVMGKKKITCSRGTANIDINDIREFRVAKSARAIQARKTNYPSGLANARLSKNVMADFNIVIGSPVSPILERATDIEIDPMQDVKYYVGESSYFTTNNPEFIFKNFKRLMLKEDSRVFAIISDAIPGRLLRQNGSIESIKDLQLSNKKSKLRKLVSEERINFEEIPPQIKAMMSKAFNVNENIDPLKNRESRAIIDETQKNIFLVRALVGFEMDEDGFPDLNRPIMENMSESNLSGRPILAKAYNYEVPELGVVKDKFTPTIYNNLLYIRG